MKLMELPRKILVVVVTLSLVFSAAIFSPVLASTVVVNSANAAANNFTLSTTSSDGSSTFVTGPATPPLGTGSVRLFTGTNGGGAAEIKSTGYSNVQITNISNLSYSTYATSYAFNKLPMIELHVTVPSYEEVIVFEPRYNSSQGTPTLNQWQTWDASGGLWQTALGLVTLEEYAAFFAPDVPQIGTNGIKFIVGGGQNSDVYDENIDNMSITVGGSNTMYDFEFAAGNGDSDGDGFTDAVEAYIGTNPNAACGLNAWPPDFDNDQVVTILDLSRIAQGYNKGTGMPGYNKRLDIDASGYINIIDISLVANRYQKTCTV